jgi:tRNA-Thr(GGU) m(6)t(6)A37 methyltransferase TsaA
VELVRIGILRSPYEEKFGTPRQASVLPDVEAAIEFVSPWDTAEAVRGLEGHSHVWVLYGFHRNRPVSADRTTVRPPRLGGNERLGVFATRSPYRPNPIGLSLVTLVGVAPGRLTVRGADWVDGTPVYDVKPWLPWADGPPGGGGAEATGGGFAAAAPEATLEVGFAPGLEGHPLAERLARMLALDPRPAYRRDHEADPEAGGRTYGLRHAGHEVRWRVEDGNGRLTVTEIRNLLEERPE